MNGPAEFVKDRLYPISPEIENCTLSLYNSTTEDIPQNPLPCDERNTTEKDIFPQCRCTLEQEKTLNDEILAQVNTANLRKFGSLWVISGYVASTSDSL